MKFRFFYLLLYDMIKKEAEKVFIQFNKRYRYLGGKYDN